MLVAAACAFAAACSFFVPFSEYDKDTYLGSAGEAGEGGPGGCDSCSPDASDAGTCDADLSTDPASCGACGHGCLGRPCTAGLCQAEPIFSSARFYALSVAVDDTVLYVGAVFVGGPVDGLIGVISKDTAGVGAVAFTTAPPVRIAIAGPDLYWTQGVFVDAGAAERGIGHVSKYPVDGGVLVPPYVSGQTGPYSITVDSDRVFWTNPVPGEVWTAARSAPAGEHTVVSDPGATGLAIDPTGIYWTTTAPLGHVMHAAKDGSNPQPIAINQRVPAGLTLDADSVYWTSADPDGAIYRAPRGGGTAVEIAHSQDRPLTIAVDDTNVYWGNVGPDPGPAGSVVRAPKAGGRALVLAVGQKPTDLAIDDRFVYWASAGVLYRVPK
jgi:hypothetical protein